MMFKINFLGFLLQVISFISNAQKIVDLIPFNGDIMADFRFKYLLDVVDLFVIVESKVTFSGIQKNKYFMDIHKEWFNLLEQQNKLLRIKIDSFPDFKRLANDERSELPSVAMQREVYQRNYAVSAILKHMGNSTKFILISADADEIPSTDLIKKLPNMYNDLSKGRMLEMEFFYYSFKWIKPSKWAMAFVVNDILLKDNLVNNSVNLNNFRMNQKNFPVIHNAGWHCSYCMNPEKILHKLHSFAHAHDSFVNKSDILNLDWIKKCISDGTDLFNRGKYENCKKYNGKSGFPILSEKYDNSSFSNFLYK